MPWNWDTKKWEGKDVIQLREPPKKSEWVAVLKREEDDKIKFPNNAQPKIKPKW